MLASANTMMFEPRSAMFGRFREDLGATGALKPKDDKICAALRDGAALYDMEYKELVVMAKRMLAAHTQDMLKYLPACKAPMLEGNAGKVVKQVGRAPNGFNISPMLRNFETSHAIVDHMATNVEAKIRDDLGESLVNFNRTEQMGKEAIAATAAATTIHVTAPAATTAKERVGFAWQAKLLIKSSKVVLPTQIMGALNDAGSAPVAEE